jgi:toxin ParE1/3/4
MVERIEARVQRLEENPELGIELSAVDFPFLAPGYRRLLVSPFLIYYRIIEDAVFITHVVHERQSQRRALKS